MVRVRARENSKADRRHMMAIEACWPNGEGTRKAGATGADSDTVEL